MRPLPESTPYRRWEGDLSPRTRVPVVFEVEVSRILRSFWGLLAVLLGLAIGIAQVGSLIELRQAGADAHGIEPYVTMLYWLLWSALAVAAVTGATTLLMDKRHGALELYFTRALTPGEYLTGKCLAQFVLCTGVILVPVLVYGLASLLLFNQHPPRWGEAVAMGGVVAVGWALLVTGLALGISAVGRSVAGTVVLMAGVFVTAEVVMARLVHDITDNAYVILLSPMAVMEQLTAWLLSQPLPYEVDVVYAVAVWLVLVLFGWGLLFWRRPKVRGAEGVEE